MGRVELIFSNVPLVSCHAIFGDPGSNLTPAVASMARYFPDAEISPARRRSSKEISPALSRYRCQAVTTVTRPSGIAARHARVKRAATVVEAMAHITIA
jgi:hypothetical protein